jgi:hypothetical protein
MPRYIIESYEATLSHGGKNVWGTPADPSYAGASLYLYELDLAGDPKVVGHHSGQNRANSQTAPTSAVSRVPVVGVRWRGQGALAG